jgi:signal transduction histidine kinase
VRDEAERKLAHLRSNISLILPHEMRTPLNGIISNAELLATSADTLKPSDIAEMGQEIHNSSLRLERLIENFLIFAQLELIAADPKSVSALRVGKTEHAASVVQKVAGEVASQSGRTADLKFETSDFTLPMSNEYFSRVAAELVLNAFKFSAPRSPVVVRLVETFNTITFSVKDSGRGFSNDQVTRIGAYMQFDRKMQDQQGLGLGLTIARRLVELHGGTLAIESEKNVGATVTAKFPKAKTP